MRTSSGTPAKGRRGSYRGHLQVAETWDDFLEVLDDYVITVGEVVDCGGGRVLAEVDRIATAKASGIRGTFPISLVITVNDGLITRIDEYVDRSEVLEAAGLRE